MNNTIEITKDDEKRLFKTKGGYICKVIDVDDELINPVTVRIIIGSNGVKYNHSFPFALYKNGRCTPSLEHSFDFLEWFDRPITDADWINDPVEEWLNE